MLDIVKRPDRGHARYGTRGAASKARKAHSFNNTHKIDFKEINEAALRSLPLLLARWLPGGKRIGKEYIALNPTREDRRHGQCIAAGRLKTREYSSYLIRVPGSEIARTQTIAAGES